MKMKLKELYNRHKNKIVIFLLLWVLLKGCKEVMMDRKYDYTLVQIESINENIKDSLMNTIESADSSCLVKDKIIDSLSNEIIRLNDKIDLRERENAFLRKQNMNLINYSKSNN